MHKTLISKIDGLKRDILESSKSPAGQTKFITYTCRNVFLELMGSLKDPKELKHHLIFFKETMHT